MSMANILRKSKKQSHSQQHYLPKKFGIKLNKEMRDFEMKLGKAVENGELPTVADWQS